MWAQEAALGRGAASFVRTVAPGQPRREPPELRADAPKTVSAAYDDRVGEPTQASGPRGSKSSLRSQAQRRRADRPAELARAADSHRTRAVVDQIAELSGADQWVVAAYWSAPHEPDTHRLVTWLSQVGHRVLLPILSTGREHPSWGWFSHEDDLVVGARGLAQPAGQPVPAVTLSTADLVLCPGLLGGRDGSRLGTGGGWYDRALADLPPATPRWLLLFADEVVDAVPTEPHDLGVSDLVTESGWVHCRQSDAG